MPDTITPRHVIYKQDCEFYRFQDRLRWGRFQTAATVEAGLLFSLFTLRQIGAFYHYLFLLAGFLLVLVLSLLAVKDGSDAERHLKRIRDFEKRIPLAPSTWPTALRGRNLMMAAIGVLNLFNLILLICQLVKGFQVA